MSLELKVHLKWMQSKVRTASFHSLPDYMFCRNKENTHSSWVVSHAAKEQCFYLERWPMLQEALTFLVTFKIDFWHRYIDAKLVPCPLARWRWGLWPINPSKSVQHLKMLRGKKSLLINENCNVFLWRKWWNSVYKYSMHCLVFQCCFSIPSSVL